VSRNTSVSCTACRLFTYVQVIAWIFLKTEQMQFIDVRYLAQACFTVYREIGSWCNFFLYWRTGSQTHWYNLSFTAININDLFLSFLWLSQFWRSLSQNYIMQHWPGFHRRGYIQQRKIFITMTLNMWDVYSSVILRHCLF